MIEPVPSYFNVSFQTIIKRASNIEAFFQILYSCIVDGGCWSPRSPSKPRDPSAHFGVFFDDAQELQQTSQQPSRGPPVQLPAMLSCSRCCLRGKARPAIDFNPASQNEPLLFLYPRLFSTHSSRGDRHGHGRSHSGARPRTRPIIPRPHFKTPVFNPPDSKGVPSNFVSVEQERSSAFRDENESIDALDRESPFAFHSDGYVNHLKNHFENLPPRNACANKWKDVPLKDRPAPHERGKQEVWLGRLDEERVDHLMDMNKVYPWAFADSRHNLPLDYEQGQRLNYMKRAEDQYTSSREATRGELRRCLKVAESLLDFHGMSPEMLKQKTSSPTGDKVLYVPESAVVTLFGHEYENRVGLKLGSGCQTFVMNKRESDSSGRRKVILTGSPRAIEMAEEQFRKAAERDTSVFARGRFVDTPLRPVWSNIRDENDRRRIAFINMRPSEIPRPENWNAKSLAFYIDDLTRCRLPESKLLQDFPHELAFFDEIGDHIIRLLEDPNIQKYISSKVAKAAISFFVHHGRLTKLNRILPMFDELLTTRTFNELLRAASRRSDLYLFDSYISIMKETGVAPNGWEWVHFLKSIRSPKLRSYMLVYLHQKGVLHKRHILQAAVADSLQDSFCYHISTGQDVFAYLDGLKQVFGPWISTTAINNLVLEASWMKSPEALAAIIDYCRKTNVPLDNGTLSFGLMYFVDTKRFLAGAEFFLNMIHKDRVLRSDVATQLLWVLAWRRRAYNVCRLVWRYSCMEGTVSWEMQNLVLSSVRRNTPANTEIQGERWRKAIGKVVIGVENDFVAPPVRHESDPDDLWEEPQFVRPQKSFRHLTEWRDSGTPERYEQYKAGTRAVTRDLKAYDKYEPLMAFEDLLMIAVRRDIEWGGAHHDPDWIAENAIRVPVVEKRPYEMRSLRSPRDKIGFDPYVDGKQQRTSEEKGSEPSSTASEKQQPERVQEQEQSAQVSTSRPLDPSSREPLSSDPARPQIMVRFLKPNNRPVVMDYPSR